MLEFAKDRPLLKWLLPAAAVSGVVLLIIVGLRLFGGERLPSPAALQTTALDQSLSQEHRVGAALKLNLHGSVAQPQMRQLLRESPDSDVRAAAIVGLMEHGDWNDVPLLIEALDDPSPWVRSRAARAVWRQMGTTFDFNADAPQAERRKTIEKIQRKFKWQSDYREMHHDSPTANQRVE